MPDAFDAVSGTDGYYVFPNMAQEYGDVICNVGLIRFTARPDGKYAFAFNTMPVLGMKNRGRRP